MLEELEKYAKVNHIPIMEKDGINFLIELIKKNNVKKILEIGSAIGYSAIKMALVDSDIKITTIERDKQRYDEALKNIAKFNLCDQIEIILADALEANINGKFDMIFIDAAKAQNIKFFEKYKTNLEKYGIIVTDNLNFHGLVFSDKTNLSKNLRNLITKIENYITFLKENKEFKTEFKNVGDGISISKRSEYNE